MMCDLDSEERWTKDEHALLRNACAENRMPNGQHEWSRIAELLPTRSQTALRLQWYRLQYQAEVARAEKQAEQRVGDAVPPRSVSSPPSPLVCASMPRSIDPDRETIYYGVHSTELRAGPQENWSGGDIGWLIVTHSDTLQPSDYFVKWSPANNSASPMPTPWGVTLLNLRNVTYTFGGRHLKGRMYPPQILFSSPQHQVIISFHNAELANSGRSAVREVVSRLLSLCRRRNPAVVFETDGPWFATSMETRDWSDRSVAVFQAARKQPRQTAEAPAPARAPISRFGTAWTWEEEAILNEARKSNMHSWEVIAQMLPGRSANAVRTHWQCLQHRKRQERLEAQKKRDRQHAVDNAGNVTPAPSPPLALGEVRPVAPHGPTSPTVRRVQRARPAGKDRATGTEGGDIP